MRLSRTIAYAVEATLELARAEPNCPVSCSELARHGKLPKRFLLQILRKLVEREVLCSVRGVGGGYYLARRPEEITLLDVVEAIETPQCPELAKFPQIPKQRRENLLVSVVKVFEAAQQELRKTTLADLVQLP
jgi:Rrf2 family protein